LSFGFPWGAALEAGIARLARIVRGLAGNGSQTPSNVS
jgi:hypothetical protein